MTPLHTRNKNKTLTIWLALLGGGLGWHRLYLYGWRDGWVWVHAFPTVLGLWGLDRATTYGIDDRLSWWLLPLLGLSVAVACLSGIVYALQTPEHWNARHQPDAPSDAVAGRSNWLTVLALVLTLMWGSTALLSSLVYGFQRYFETQVEAGLRISR